MNNPDQKVVSVNVPIWKLYGEPLTTLNKLMLDHGDRVKINTPWPLYLINDAELTYHILKKTNYLFDKNLFNYKMLSRIIGRGIVCNHGEQWEHSRNTIKPFFTTKHGAQWQATIDAALASIIDNWQQYKKQGTAVDASDDVAQLAFATIVGYVFGVQLNGRYSDLCKSLEEMDFTAIEGLMLPFDFVPTRMNRQMHRLHQEIKRLIIELSKESNISGKPALSQSLYLHLTEEQVIQELTTLLFAGYATVSSLLTWGLYLIASNIAAAEPLYKESNAAVEDMDISEMDTMEYTTAFVKETMRLYPPVWMLPRRCTENHEVNGFNFRKNMLIWIVPWTLHRNPRYWQEPEQFLPNRFLSHEKSKAHNKAYIPFSIGPRMCIGKNFGLAESIYMISKLTRKFRFRLPQDYKTGLTSMIAVKPQSRLMLSLTDSDLP